MLSGQRPLTYNKEPYAGAAPAYPVWKTGALLLS